MISAIVITKNEEKGIFQCIKSLSWADEVIVVDAESTDSTCRIAKDLGAEVIVRPWQGYVAQRRFAISKARGDWILFVDADEVVTDELREDILARVGREEYSGYYINRKNHFLSRPVNHCGWAPDFVLRCFKKDAVSIPDVRIHEGFQILGETSKLKGDLLHFSYGSISEYFDKMNRYTSLEVEDKLERIGNKKILWYDILFHSLSRFFRMYFVRKGYKDGQTGFLVCFFSSVYLFVLYAKIWEQQKNSNI